MPKCANCGTELDEGAKFCLECGTPVPQTKKCIKCGFELPLSAKFCPECGTKQDGQANPNAGGSGFSMGDKNVIAGDVIGHKEETHIAGNATIIKNEDETKKTARCHICGSIVQIVDGFDCPECHQFTCSACYDQKEGCCSDCAKIHGEQKLNRYKEALRMVLADRRIEQSERLQLIKLQQELGISSEVASKLEEEFKKSIQGIETEITTVEKISIDKAKEYFYKEGKIREALNLLEPIYNVHKNDEEVLNVFLPVLAETAPIEAQNIISALKFDILTSFIVSIKIYLKQKNLVEAEKKLIQAARIWRDSSLLKCYQVLFNLAMYKQWKKEEFLQKAKEMADNLGEAKDNLELSYQVKVQAILQETCGEIASEFSKEFCDQNGLYFYIMDNNPILDEIENKKEKELKEAKRQELIQAEKEATFKKENEIQLKKLQEQILSNPKNYSLDELLSVEKEFHNSQIQFLLCRYYENKKDWNNSFYWAEKSAAQNNADGIARLGTHYVYGNGCNKDEQKAYELAKKSTDMNSSWGYNLLGYIYFVGSCGVTQNKEEAIKLYKLAAEQGNENAQYNLGKCYNLGRGVNQDYAQAVKWYKLSAEQGNANAQNSLGLMYKYGNGVPQDYEQALRWYELSAEQGNASAQFNLGKMYENGEGIPQDLKKAFKWIKLAAENSNTKDSDCQYLLGNLYKDGIGTEKDYTEALKWYKKAAEQNHYDAAVTLGSIYEDGDIVEKNYSEAEKWLLIAIAAAEEKNKESYIINSTIENLGKLYTKEKKYSDAEKIYKKLLDFAQKNNEMWIVHNACEYLAEICYKRDLDYTESIKWYELDAESTQDLTSMAELHYLYCSPDNEKNRDYAAALKWGLLHEETKKSQDSKIIFDSLELSIANIYYNGGFGVKKDRIQAVKWFSKALSAKVESDEYVKAAIKAIKKGIYSPQPHCNLYSLA